MTEQDIADIIWVGVTVVATTSITNNIVGFHLNRIERRINALAEMIEKHGELLKRVGKGDQ